MIKLTSVKEKIKEEKWDSPYKILGVPLQDIVMREIRWRVSEDIYLQVFQYERNVFKRLWIINKKKFPTKTTKG